MPRYLSIITLITVFLAVAASGSAQEGKYNPGRFYLGVKGGGNITTTAPQNNYGQNLMQYRLPLSGTVGLYTQYVVSDRSSISVEVAYQRHRQVYSNMFKRSQFDRSVSLDYVAVPLMYKYLFKKEQRGYEGASTFFANKWYLSLGLQPAILMNAESEWKIDDQETDFITFITEGGNPNEEEIASNQPPGETEDLFRPFDLSLIGALGFQRRLDYNLLVFVEVRGGLGLTDMNAEQWRLPSPGGTYLPGLNMFIGIHAGITYKLF